MDNLAFYALKDDDSTTTLFLEVLEDERFEDTKIRSLVSEVSLNLPREVYGFKYIFVTVNGNLIYYLKRLEFFLNDYKLCPASEEIVKLFHETVGKTI